MLVQIPNVNRVLKATVNKAGDQAPLARAKCMLSGDIRRLPALYDHSCADRHSGADSDERIEAGERVQLRKIPESIPAFPLNLLHPQQHCYAHYFGRMDEVDVKWCKVWVVVNTLKDYMCSMLSIHGVNYLCQQETQGSH